MHETFRVHDQLPRTQGRRSHKMSNTTEIDPPLTAPKGKGTPDQLLAPLCDPCGPGIEKVDAPISAPTPVITAPIIVLKHVNSIPHQHASLPNPPLLSPRTLCLCT